MPCLSRNVLNRKRFILVAISLTLFYVLFANHMMFDAVKFIHKSNEKLENYHFNFRINNDICSGDIYLLIIIHSAVDHFKHRQVIRDTWGEPGEHLPKVKVAFLLAMADDVQQEINEENDLHKDIIQGDFIDSYHNLTYKHTMGLAWVSKYCNRTRFILKMDDDIFMDIYQFLEYMQDRFQESDLKNHIACYHQKSMPVVRDPVSKWYVSKSEFLPDTFDDYCSGWAYLMTPHVADLLHQSVKKLPYFWVDDVHITGTARKAAGVQLIRMNSLYALETDGLSEWCHSLENLKWNKVFAPTWGDLELVRKAHKKSLTCYVTNCKCCYFRKTTPRPSTTSTTVRGRAQLIPLSSHKKKKNFL